MHYLIPSCTRTTVHTSGHVDCHTSGAYLSWRALIVAYLLVQLQPGWEALLIHILKTKEPYFPQTNGFHHLHRTRWCDFLCKLVCVNGAMFIVCTHVSTKTFSTTKQPSYMGRLIWEQQVSLDRWYDQATLWLSNVTPSIKSADQLAITTMSKTPTARNARSNTAWLLKCASATRRP